MVSDRLGGVCHPLIYHHPKTGRPTLCFHQGMTCGFAKDYDENKESNALLSEKVLLIFSEAVLTQERLLFC